MVCCNIEDLSKGSMLAQRLERALIPDESKAARILYTFQIQSLSLYPEAYPKSTPEEPIPQPETLENPSALLDTVPEISKAWRRPQHKAKKHDKNHPETILQTASSINSQTLSSTVLPEPVAAQSPRLRPSNSSRLGGLRV